MDTGYQERSAAAGPAHLRIGCALLPKKAVRYLTPEMLALARASGVELTTINIAQSLEQQGPFDAIVHKLRPSADWEKNLRDYVQRHPGVVVIDSVDGIRTLQNRSTMLSVLHEASILIHRAQEDVAPAAEDDDTSAGPKPYQQQQPSSALVQSPTQVELTEGVTLAQAKALLKAAGLSPPLLVKPLWTDGREGSHGLAVLHDLHSLEKLLSGQVSSDLQPPLVVQQYVAHGGVLFKVYVLGDRTVVSTRPSLGQRYLGHEAKRQGLLQLPRISCRPRQFGRASASTNNISDIDAAACGNVASASTPALDALLNAASVAAAGSGAGARGGGGVAAAAHRCKQTMSPASSTPGISKRAALAAAGSLPATPQLLAPATPACTWERMGDQQDPPEWVTHALAQELRQRLGLQLFNFDLIKPEDQQTGEQSLWFVIDVNYFPGVDKIPDFERVFVDFLRSAASGEPQQYPQQVLSHASVQDRLRSLDLCLTEQPMLCADHEQSLHCDEQEGMASYNGTERPGGCVVAAETGTQAGGGAGMSRKGSEGCVPPCLTNARLAV